MKVNGILECIKRNVASRVRDPLLCAGEVLYLGDACCVTRTGAGSRLAVLEYRWSEVLCAPASPTFIQEEFGALLKVKL